jgi:hypothetical protein
MSRWTASIWFWTATCEQIYRIERRRKRNYPKWLPPLTVSCWMASISLKSLGNRFTMKASDCSCKLESNLAIINWSFMTMDDAYCYWESTLEPATVWKVIRRYLFVLLSLWLSKGFVNPFFDVEFLSGERCHILQVAVILIDLAYNKEITSKWHCSP